MIMLEFDCDDSATRVVKQLLSADPSDALFEAIEWLQLRAKRGFKGRHVLHVPGKEPLHIEAWLKL